MLKRFVGILLSAVILLSCTLIASGGFIYSAQYVPGEDTVTFDWFDKNLWEAVEGIRDIKIRNTGSSNLLYIISDKQAERMAVECTFEEALDLSMYNELAVEFIVSNSKECTYQITYFYEGGSYSDSVMSKKGSRNMAYFTLPYENSDQITKIEISVFNEKNDLNYFAVSSFSADNNRTYSYGERFQCRRVVSLYKNVNYYDDYIEVIPRRDESSLECELLTDFEKESAVVVVEIDSSYTGILTLENTSTGDSNSTAMYVGVAKYSFILTELENNIRISFSEGDASENSSVRFLSLKVVQVSKDNKMYGTIESCAYDNGKLIIKGTIDSDVAIEYIDSKIALYKVPYSYEEGPLEHPEVEMDISTFYELEAPVSYDYTQYKYVVALKNNDNVVPISTPVFAMQKSSLPVISQECDVGLHNIGNTAFFESEAETVIVDVYTNKLFVSADKIAATRFTYRDNVYYINSDYVNELSATASFAASVGGKVYFRILTSESGSFDFNINRRSSVSVMSAVSSYLGAHFKQLSGVILLSGVDYESGFEESIKQSSELLGIFTTVFRNENSSAEILAAIPEGNEHIAPLFSKYNKLNCIDDICVIYEFNKQENSVNNIKAICDSAALFGVSFRSSILFWSVDKTEAVLENFKDLFETAVQRNIAGVVFSIDEDSVIVDEVCNNIALLYSSEYLRYEYDAFKSDVDFRGSYNLWDFTESYDTFGWLAGGDCSAPETAKSGYSDKRVIRSIITPSEDKEGILVGWFESVTDLSSADILTVDLAVNSEEKLEMPISIVLGGKGTRAEYKAVIQEGEHSINLNLSSFPQANRVEYIAIIVNSETKASLEISKLSAVSHTLSDDELKPMAQNQDDGNTERNNLYVFFGAVITSAVVVFIALSKKKTAKQNNGKIS